MLFVVMLNLYCIWQYLVSKRVENCGFGVSFLFIDLFLSYWRYVEFDLLFFLTFFGYSVKMLTRNGMFFWMKLKIYLYESGCQCEKSFRINIRQQMFWVVRRRGISAWIFILLIQFVNCSKRLFRFRELGFRKLYCI